VSEKCPGIALRDKRGGSLETNRGHPLKGTSSMKKLPRSRKKQKSSLRDEPVDFARCFFPLLAAPDISLVCVGGFFTAPVTHQDQGLRRCVVTFLPATLCAPSANRRSRKSAVPYRVQSFSFKSNGFEPTPILVHRPVQLLCEKLPMIECHTILHDVIGRPCQLVCQCAVGNHPIRPAGFAIIEGLQN